MVFRLYPYTQNSQDTLDSTNSDTHFMNTMITECTGTGTTRNPSFCLRWKFDESAKHYLTQMLLAINWRYWQKGRISRMRMKVQGRFMQARFIELHQVFPEKKKDRIFSNRLV